MLQSCMMDTKLKFGPANLLLDQMINQAWRSASSLGLIQPNSTGGSPQTVYLKFRAV